MSTIPDFKKVTVKKSFIVISHDQILITITIEHFMLRIFP